MEITGEMRQKMLLEETRKFLEESKQEIVKRVEKRIRQELSNKDGANEGNKEAE